MNLKQLLKDAAEEITDGEHTFMEFLLLWIAGNLTLIIILWLVTLAFGGGSQ